MQTTEEKLINELNKSINDIIKQIDQTMKNDGDTPETSQRMTVINKLIGATQAVNGITKEDLL